MTALLFAIRHWRALLSGAVVITLVITATYYRIDRNHWRAVAHTLRLDLDNVKTATELADQKAKAAKLATEAEYRRKAEETDRAYEAQLDAARSRADRYADRMRVHAPGAAGGPVAAAPDCGPEGSERACGTPDMVAVSTDDFRILNENTVRLQQAHEWACKQEGAKCVDRPAGD